MKTNTPQVAIIMGSDSDWPALKPAADACAEFGIPCSVQVVSAHRTPMDMVKFARTAHTRGFQVIIAGAGGAAHLPGMVASLTPLPVIGVPVESKSLKGLDSLLSIVQMPGGVPVATMAINGGRNAGLFAARILAAADAELLKKILSFQAKLAAESKSKNRRLQSETKSYQQT
jgi:5-(carboxyamino)imidazole ribonucleotide mutase